MNNCFELIYHISATTKSPEEMQKEIDNLASSVENINSPGAVKDFAKNMMGALGGGGGGPIQLSAEAKVNIHWPWCW